MLQSVTGESQANLMLARYYSSSLGRFMAADPGDDTALEDPQSWNKYSYVRNNPLALVDPNGESATLAGAAIGFVAAGATALVQGKSWREAGAAAMGGAVAGAMVGSIVDTGGASLGVMVAAGAMGGASGVLTENMLSGRTASAGEVAMGAAGGAAGVMAGASVGAVLEGAAARAATAAAPAGRPNFVVTPQGEAIPVPSGAAGPTPTRAPGVQYTGGSGGRGLDPKVTGVRIMEGNANQGPRAVYMNAEGQTVNPATGRTVPHSDPSAHHPLRE